MPDKQCYRSNIHLKFTSELHRLITNFDQFFNNSMNDYLNNYLK